MKTAILPALLFLFALFTTMLHSTTADIVQDTQNYAVINKGGPYYFLSLGGDHDTGLQIARTGNDACALSVVQAPSQTQGLPLRISSANPRHPISTDSFVNIEFDGGDGLTPTHWRVREGSVIVGFDNETPQGPFKIRKAMEDYGSYGYAIVYCPPDSGDSDDACKYLKIVTDDDNNKRLVLDDGTDSWSDWHVLFKKKDAEQRCMCTCPEVSVA